MPAMNMIFRGWTRTSKTRNSGMGRIKRSSSICETSSQPKLSPRYIAAVEERVYVEGPNRQIEPDLSIRLRSPRPEAEVEAGGVAVLVEEADDPMVVVAHEIEVHESYIAILDRKNGLSVVTILEVVSPGNKCVGPGRRSYVEKQAEILRGDTHLVEVDLLRAGPHVLAVPQSEVGPRVVYDYLTSVNRSRGDRSVFEVYPTLLRRDSPAFAPARRRRCRRRPRHPGRACQDLRIRDLPRPAPLRSTLRPSPLPRRPGLGRRLDSRGERSVRDRDLSATRVAVTDLSRR